MTRVPYDSEVQPAAAQDARVPMTDAHRSDLTTHGKFTGRFIAPDRADMDAPRLRTEVEIVAGHGAVVGARMLLSALGVVEASIDGHPVSDDLLTPERRSLDLGVSGADLG